jgi:hypothetical protein
MQTLEGTHIVRGLVAALAAAGVATGITLAPVSMSSAAAATTAEACPPTKATGWSAAVIKAQQALASAVTSLINDAQAAAAKATDGVVRQVLEGHVEPDPEALGHGLAAPN